MSFASQLDKLATIAFPQLTFLICRDVVKEMQGANETVMKNEMARLNDAQKDILMKVIYVALGNDCKNSPLYFKWHAALYEAAGVGSIVRVITDKPAFPV